MTAYRVKEPPLGSVGAPSVKPLDSFATVVEAHWTSTYKMLYYLTGRSHDAEDLTQDTFLRALRHWNHFQQGTNMRAWLLRIAVNAFLDMKRRALTRNTGPLFQEVESREKSTEVALENREEAELIRTAIQDLPELARIVFHLRVTEDMSYKEIARLAGMRPALMTASLGRRSALWTSSCTGSRLSEAPLRRCRLHAAGLFCNWPLPP
jgi:RNA polymerase sigma-70 factor, ECF subfamily